MNAAGMNAKGMDAAGMPAKGMDVVLISPVSPFDPRDGHRLAVLSDVRALLDNQVRLGLIVFTYADDHESMAALCPTTHIPVLKGGFGKRLARSLFKGLPPSAERFYSSEAHQSVCESLKKWSPGVVIIDDASVSGFIPDVRRLLPNTKVVLRSHNVMQDVRKEQVERTNGPERAAVAFDCQRYIAFEKTAVLSSDRHWAITPADAERMERLYHRPGKCLTVSIPFERYESIGPRQGKCNGFVHVGSLDFRRRNDLNMFLDQSWPRILQADHSASLTLAGELKGEPIPARNVEYAGRVKSDADLYGQARFALNFQSSPGGVKLKTLTSLAAGRTLLSTKEGVAGIDIQSGLEFFHIDHFLQRPDLPAVLNDQVSTQVVAEAGRDYVNKHHSRAAVARQLAHLLEGV